MAKTKDELISDIELRLTKFKPSDDVELERSLIGHWLDVAATEIVRMKTNEEMMSGNDPSQIYVKIIDGITPFLDIIMYGKGEKSQLTLLPFPGDDDTLINAVIWKILDHRGRRLVPSDSNMSEEFQYLWFAAPGECNIFYHREGRNTRITGIKPHEVNEFSFRIYYIPEITAEEDEVYPVEDLLIPSILDRAEEIGRRAMQGKQDIDNDGTDV